MLGTLKVAARDRARLGEVAAVMSRFGLDVLLARLGLGSAQDEPEPFDLPDRTRRALEALGPTWVKLGQIMATRADILPPEWIAAFEQLQSSAPRLPFEDLRPAVETALGEPPETVFAQFDAEPLAAASMAQVHRATLPDGTAVVVKIRRPGIRPRMEADLRLLGEVARVMERSNAEARRFGATKLIRQLGSAILGELDFANEGRNADLLRDDFARDSRVLIPRIHWDYTSEALIVMDHIPGVPPRNAQVLRDAGIDPAVIAASGADIVLQMALINGRFHGDPHPGNLLCLPGNRIGMIDFGLIGHVSPRRREEFIAFVQALVTDDPALLAETLARWAELEHQVPRFMPIAEGLVVRHGRRLVLADLVADLFGTLREEKLAFPPDLLLLFKALITLDGVLGAIEPDFDLAAAMRRASGRLVMERLSPERWSRRAAAVALEVDRLGDDLPRLIRALVRRAEAPPAPAPAQPFDSRILAAALIVAALIIAAAIMLT